MRNNFFRFLSAFIVTGILISFSFPIFTVNAQANSAEIAVELTTGTVLKENNADAKLPMASTTKIMTALLIAEDCDIDREVTVPECAVGIEGSSIYLKKDEKINVRDLLYGLMLRSGNDSATALAIIHSGSVEKFVERMNIRAKEVGAVNTNFTNPSGLPDDNHYTTARDLAKIACVAMKNNIIKKVAGTKNYRGKYRNFTNKNKLLYDYEGANGVKTGYTVKAGRCLVSSAQRHGMDVVCVVLNCYDMYERSKSILNECFSNYECKKIDENRTFMCNNVLCKIANNTNIVINRNKQILYRIIPYDSRQKNTKNNIEGKIQFFTQNRLIFEADLYSIVSR